MEELVVWLLAAFGCSSLLVMIAERWIQQMTGIAELPSVHYRLLLRDSEPKHQHLDMQSEGIQNRFFKNMRYIIFGVVGVCKNNIARINIRYDVFHSGLLE